MKKVVIWIALSLWSVMTVFAGETAYLFSYFINDSKDGLHLAYSYDGLNWLPLHGGRSYLTPAVGKDKLMRDPSICQSPDGTFHMVWTSSWTDRIIGYASSRDLVHWSEQQAIPVMMHEPDAHNCWAPELFYDEPSQTYYIFWATTIPGRHKEVATSESEKGLNHRIYYVTTKDFRTFSKTKMFFNPDFSVIDAAIVKDPKREDLIMVVKNENSNPPEKNLRVTRTKKIEKGFPTKVSAPITGKYWAEGPAPLFVGDTLYVYFDKYRDHRYGAVRSLDYGETWEDVSDQVFFPRGIRHGTAFAVDVSIVESLIADRNYNPLIPDNLADPSVSKFGDTYYLYGTSGFEKARTYDADLIICDVLMPGMTGFEVTKKLKTDFDTSHIPIILLTALNSPEKHLEGIEAGADAYIAKPFSVKLLLARVFRLIEQRDKLREKFSSEPGIVRPAMCTTDRDKEFADRLAAILEQNLARPEFSIDEFAQLMKLGRTVFYRKLRGVTGYSPNEYLRVVRMKKAAELLLSEDNLTVAEVSYKVGISDPFYFSKCFKAQFGVAPSVYQRGVNSEGDSM